MTGSLYGGDVLPPKAWDILQTDPDAVLIDVRTDAEWAFVGVPDLSGVGRNTVLVEWQSFPEMAINPDFVGEVKAHGIRPDQTLLLICRSGQRSRHAAMALTDGGFERCLNVAEGFEGGLDAARHRGAAGGWKAAGLAWIQQ